MYRGHFLRASHLVIVALLSSALLAYFTWLQLHNFSTVMVEVSWIEPLGPLSALWEILGNLLPATGENWVALFAVGMIAVIPGYRPRSLRLSLIWLIAGSAAFATTLVLIINQRFPLVFPSYFGFLAIESIAIISLSIGNLLSAKPWILALIFANAGIYMISNFKSVIDDRELLADADTIKQLVAQCPTTRVHAGSRPPTAGEDPVIVIAPPQSEQTALEGLAASDQLTLLPLAPDTPGDCPVIYWTEYRAPSKLQLDQHNGDVKSAVNDSAGFGLDAATLARASVVRMPSGYAMALVVSGKGAFTRATK